MAAHRRLHTRFYRVDGSAAIEESASSHWRTLSQGFSVRGNGDPTGALEMVGYGFGESGSFDVFALVSAWIGNTLRLASLRNPKLVWDIRRAKAIVRRMGLRFSQDAFRQVCTLHLLVRAIPVASPPARIVIIGDGHGILAALLHTWFPRAQVILIDLGSVLVFQSYHLNAAFPNAKQAIADEDVESEAATFVLCPADSLDALPKGTFDLGVNVASMQEMAPTVTARYFELLRNRRTRLFYCCNRVEKRLEGGEVSRFFDYPWLQADKHIVDEPCPWHQWFFGRSASPHVTLLGVGLPFFHRYDGPHWHRLTELSH